MSEQTKTKGSSATKNIILALFVIAAALFVWKRLELRKTIQQENDAIAILEDSRYEEALAAFTTLNEKASGEARKRHQTNIARCYMGMADEEGLSMEEQMKLYSQAASFDVTVITNPVILKALKAQEMRETGGTDDTSDPAANETETKPAE